MMKKNLIHEHLNLDIVFEKKNSDMFLDGILNPVKIIYTAYGRNALFLGMSQISVLTSKRTVLVPGYSCGDEIEAIKAAGFRIKVYSISENLEVEKKDLETKIDKDTTAILVTHYFGFPNNIEYLSGLAKKNNLFLIEDCAHALGSKYNSKYVGSFGDIAVFSLRKFYPIPHGGALVINNDSIPKPRAVKMPNEALEKDLSIFFGYRSGFFQPGTAITNVTKQANRHGARLEEYGGYKLGISKFVLNLVQNLELNISQRQDNFKYYLDYFKDSKAKVLFDEISEDINPLYFPIAVNDSEKIASKLRNYDEIFTQPFWSFLHKYVDWNKFPEAKRLKQSIMILPVHQKIDEKYLSRLLKVI